jgi:hypothetical protein
MANGLLSNARVAHAPNDRSVTIPRSLSGRASARALAEKPWASQEAAHIPAKISGPVYVTERGQRSPSPSLRVPPDRRQADLSTFR